MPTDFSSEEFKKALAELEEEGDRAAAIVGGSIIESFLEKGILMRLLPLSPALRESIFSGYGPLSSMSAKIDISFALGLFGDHVRIDLHHIRRVRNEFAHHPNRDFNHPNIAKWCEPLETIERAENPTEGVPANLKNRIRFIQAVHLICGLIITEAVSHPSRPHQSTWKPIAPKAIR